MNDQDIILELEKREVVRKGLSQLRNNGIVPGVIHDHGKPSTHVQGNYLKIAKVYEKAGKHHMVELKIEGKKDSAIIKDVNYDPVKNKIRHVVFQSVRQNESIETEVPIRLEGEIPAEKVGLMVLNGLTHLVIEALPKDLPDEIVVNATKLVEIGDKITVQDIKAPSGVSIVNEPEEVIASVEETKAQISEEAEESSEEGEVGGEAKAESKQESVEEK